MTCGISLLPILLLHIAWPLDGTAAAIIDSAAAVKTDGAADRTSGLRTESTSSSAQSTLLVEVISSGRSCEVRVGGRPLLKHRPAGTSDPHQHHQLGLHALTLNPRTARRTGYAFAPGGVSAGAFVELASFVAGVQPGRVVVLCQQPEADMMLDEQAEQVFRSLNASFAVDLQAHSALALIAVKDGAVLAEGYRPHLAALVPGATAPSLRLTASVPTVGSDRSVCQPPTPTTAAEQRRQFFCQRHDGYGALCDCSALPSAKPAVGSRPLPDGTLFSFPVVVVSRGRPRHLHRCLMSLFASFGLDLAQVLVVIGDSGGSDGAEQRDLLRVLRVAWHQIPVQSDDASASFHLSALQFALTHFSSASKLAVLEDNVEVSPDFLSYLQQTHGALDADVSLYGVSAGNELGYRHAVADRTQVHRADTAPAGAWLLTRRLLEHELLPRWPSSAPATDLSEALRHTEIRRGRDCVVPLVPRFYRFAFNESDDGTDYLYHWDRAASDGRPVTLRGVSDLVLPNYRRRLMTLLRDTVKLDGSQAPLSCPQMLPPNATGQTLVLSVRMLSVTDAAGWQRAAACLGLWDRDVRGHHSGVWRFQHGSSTVLVLGVPFSPLSGYVLMHGSGRLLLVSGRRSTQQRRRGRWPPGRPRPGPDGLLSRYRLAAAASGLDRHQLEEILQQRGQLDHVSDAGEDDGDLQLEDIE